MGAALLDPAHLVPGCGVRVNAAAVAAYGCQRSASVRAGGGCSRSCTHACVRRPLAPRASQSAERDVRTQAQVRGAVHGMMHGTHQAGGWRRSSWRWTRRSRSPQRRPRRPPRARRGTLSAATWKRATSGALPTGGFSSRLKERIRRMQKNPAYFHAHTREVFSQFDQSVGRISAWHSCVSPSCLLRAPTSQISR